MSKSQYSRYKARVSTRGGTTGHGARGPGDYVTPFDQVAQLSTDARPNEDIASQFKTDQSSMTTPMRGQQAPSPMEVRRNPTTGSGPRGLLKRPSAFNHLIYND